MQTLVSCVFLGKLVDLCEHQLAHTQNQDSNGSSIAVRTEGQKVCRMLGTVPAAGNTSQGLRCWDLIRDNTYSVILEKQWLLIFMQNIKNVIKNLGN